MEKKAKIAWLYVIAALFVAAGLFFVVKKNTYLFFALPVVLGVLLLYIFSLDKVLLLTAFTVPLSFNLKALEAGLAISLPAEPLLMGILVLFVARLLYNGQYDRRISRHPIAIVIYCMFIWMVVTTITFPEGMTMAQIFDKLEAEGVCSAADLYKAAADFNFSFRFLENVGTGDAARLEGFRREAPDLPAAELVWRLIEELDLLALCSAMSDGAQRRARLMETVALAERFESSGYRGLHRFVLWLRRQAERQGRCFWSRPT